MSLDLRAQSLLLLRLVKFQAPAVNSVLPLHHLSTQLTLLAQPNGHILLPGPHNLTPKFHLQLMVSINNGLHQDGVLQQQIKPLAM